MFCKKWNAKIITDYEKLQWNIRKDSGPHEANYLRLDSSKIKNVIGWSQTCNIDVALEKIVEWTRVFTNGDDIYSCMVNQIDDFLNEKM